MTIAFDTTSPAISAATQPVNDASSATATTADAATATAPSVVAIACVR